MPPQSAATATPAELNLNIENSPLATFGRRAEA